MDDYSNRFVRAKTAVFWDVIDTRKGYIAGAETLVFWDIHNYPLPDDIDAYDLSLEVCKALRELGSSNEISLCAYGDSKNRMNGDEDERRQMVLVDVCVEIVDNRQKALNFVLIMGDVSGQMDFIRTIRLLRSRGYCNVFLVQEPPNGSGDLGSTDWLRAGLSLGENLITQSQTSAGIMASCWISRFIED